MKLDSRRTLIPMSSVATGSWLTPRMARPRLVREKNRPSSRARSSRAARTRIRWSDTWMPNTDTRSNRPRAGWMKRSPGLAQPQLQRDGQERDAGRGHQQGDPGGVEQAADDDPLGGQGHGHRGGQAEDHGRDQRDADLVVGPVEGVHGDGAELALGEVEHAARLVDEHEPEGHQPVAGAGDDPDDQCLPLSRTATMRAAATTAMAVPVSADRLARTFGMRRLEAGGELGDGLEARGCRSRPRAGATTWPRSGCSPL